MRIRYTRKALAQIDEIFAFIEARDERAARAVSARIERAIGQLARFPHSGRPTSIPGIRVLSVTRYRYLVFHIVNEVDREVYILRVRHAAQNPARHLD